MFEAKRRVGNADRPLLPLLHPLLFSGSSTTSETESTQSSRSTARRTSHPPLSSFLLSLPTSFPSFSPFLPSPYSAIRELTSPLSPLPSTSLAASSPSRKATRTSVASFGFGRASCARSMRRSRTTTTTTMRTRRRRGLRGTCSSLGEVGRGVKSGRKGGRAVLRLCHHYLLTALPSFLSAFGSCFSTLSLSLSAGREDGNKRMQSSISVLRPEGKTAERGREDVQIYGRETACVRR